MKKQTTMKCSRETQDEILKERITPRESPEEIIKRLLVAYRKIDWEAQA